MWETRTKQPLLTSRHLRRRLTVAVGGRAFVAIS